MKAKNILCFGRGYKDFIVYTAFVLNNMGYKVLVNDRSRNREMADIISHNDFECDIRTYRNIDFLFSNGDMPGYDFILTYISDISELGRYENFRYILINQSAYRTELYRCTELMEYMKTDTLFVLRDKVGNIGKKYLSKYVLPNEKLLSIYEVGYDGWDKKYQLFMDYDGVGDFKYISDDLCRALNRCISVITGKEQGDVKKALKWAKGGKVFDNRFLE